MLAGRDYQLSLARDVNLLEFGSSDLAIIDWGVLSPGSESLPSLKQNRPSSDLRLIVLAVQSHYAEPVQSLEYAADDCIQAPLKGDELLVRIKACLTRARSARLAVTTGLPVGHLPARSEQPLTQLTQCLPVRVRPDRFLII